MNELSLVIGYLGTLAAVVSYQMNNRRGVLIRQCAANALVAVSYLFQEGAKISGALICLIAAVHTVVNFLMDIRGHQPPVAVTGLFVLAYTGATGWTMWPSQHFSVLCLAAITLPRQTDSHKCFFVNAVLWIIYDVLGTLSWANLVTHICILISITVGIVRMDIRKKREQNK